MFSLPADALEPLWNDPFLQPWMSGEVERGDEDYFDDLDDEDFDDEFDDDFEEELDDDLAALNPEVTEEDLIEVSEDVGIEGEFEDEEGGGEEPDAAASEEAGGE